MYNMKATPQQKRTLKPKQLDFIDYYTNPKSDTYSNATQSAMKAGYSESYSKTHAYTRLVPLVADKIQQKEDRLIEKASKREKMLAKAEENLDKDLSIEDDASPALRAIRSKTTTFVAETVGKEVYSKAQGVENLTVNVISPNTSEVLQATMGNLLGAQNDSTPAIEADYDVIEEEPDTNE